MSDIGVKCPLYQVTLVGLYIDGLETCLDEINEDSPYIDCMKMDMVSRVEVQSLTT